MYFVVSSKSDFVVNQKSFKAIIKKRTKRDWNTLAELFEFSGQLYEVFLADDRDASNWEEQKLICSCPYYIKNNFCKQSLALAATKKFVSIPMNAKSLPLEDKPKRGRISHASKALLID